MIAIGEKYDELEFVKFGEMLLLNPDEKLEQLTSLLKKKMYRLRS